MTKYLNEWSTTAGSNTFTVPDGWPEGMTSNQINNTARETLAVIARWEKDTNGALLTTGTQPAYVATLNQTSIAAYYDGLMLCVDFHAANAGGAPTINVNSIGAKSIVYPDGTAVGTSEITLGMKALLVYDGTNFQILSYSGTSSIPVNSIDGTKIAIGSDAIGDIMYYDGTDWVILAAGTDGYHLRAKGAAAPEWEAVAANVMEFVETNAITAATTLRVPASGTLDAGYDYFISLESFAPTDDNEALWMLYSDDGTTFESGAADYQWEIQLAGASSVDDSDAQIVLAGATNFSNSAAAFNTFLITIPNPNDASENTQAIWTGGMMAVTSVSRRSIIGSANFLQGADTVQAVQFKWSGGSTFKAQGDLTVFRRKRS